MNLAYIHFYYLRNIITPSIIRMSTPSNRQTLIFITLEGA